MSDQVKELKDGILEVHELLIETRTHLNSTAKKMAEAATTVESARMNSNALIEGQRKLYLQSVEAVTACKAANESFQRESNNLNTVLHNLNGMERGWYERIMWISIGVTLGFFLFFLKDLYFPRPVIVDIPEQQHRQAATPGKR